MSMRLKSQKRGVYLSDTKLQLSKCKKNIKNNKSSPAGSGVLLRSTLKMNFNCSQSVQLSLLRVHVHLEVLKEVRKKGWNGNHLCFSHLPDPGCLRIIKKRWGDDLWTLSEWKWGLCYPIQLLGIKTPMTEPLLIINRPNRSARSLGAQFEHASGCH